MVDLHRHTEFSQFDGFGKAEELAKLAKSLGHTSLGQTDHGNTNGLIQHYKACKENGIKAILGIEAYFLPKWKEKERGFHICLFAKNLKGYGNLNRMLWGAEEKRHKYFNTIVTFEEMEEFSEGVICTSACVAGYLSQCVLKQNYTMAERAIKKFKSIFGDDFYIEIQPYKIDDEGTQETVNMRLIELAEEYGVKCILTSDSHYGSKEDFPTYLKMHEVAGHNLDWVKNTYGERYMPTEEELRNRFCSMHKKDYGGKVRGMARDMIANLEEIEDKVEENFLDGLKLNLPKVEGGKAGMSSFDVLKEKVKQGLKDRGKYKSEYIKRCKEELEVIRYHGFDDYFLIVADYVNWAKGQGIVVGPGRGSVCNSVVAYALKITEVDSILFNLDFRRFLRKDKKKFPDIDLDFETKRRHEVIEYLCEKYKGHAARICSYGLYKVDVLINDLSKACGYPIAGDDVDAEQKKANKSVMAELKSFVHSFINENGELNAEAMNGSAAGKQYNRMYDNVLVHLSKLYKKVKYIGTHAAGVAITGGKLLDYVALRMDKDGDVFTSYDLNDVEQVNVIKFDILGLKTMESIGELRKATGVTVNYDEVVKDENVLEAFREGKCDGVFQLEKNTAKNILREINCDCFMDIVAATSMNRPGPLKLKMPQMYAHNKANADDARKSKYWEYTKDSYGAIIYQEQLQQICVNIGQMSWSDADKMLKLMKNGEEEARNTLQKSREKNKEDQLDVKFIAGAIRSGLSKEEAKELFENMLVYSFVKGHGTGYSLISVEEMFYKVYYPNEYWFAKLKYAKDEIEAERFCEKAVADGSVVFLPHVNYSKPKASLRKLDDGRVIQKGLSSVKGVGEKAAEYIFEERRKHGIYRSYDDFYDRCKVKNSPVNKRVIDILVESGALEFEKKKFIRRVKQYNSALYMRGAK